MLDSKDTIGRTVVVEAGFRPGLFERRILGLPLLERTLLTAYQADIRRIEIRHPAAAGAQVRRLTETAQRPGRTMEIKFTVGTEMEPLSSCENGPALRLADGQVYHPDAIRDALAAGGDPVPMADAGDRAAVRRAENRLLQLGRKATDGFISRHINRVVSLFVTRCLLRIGVSPTPMSFVVLMIGLLSGWFAGRGGNTGFFLAGLMFQMASMLDGCDGEIARLTFRETRFGAIIDQTGDITCYFAFFVNLPLGVAATTANPLYLWLGGVMWVSIAGFYATLTVFSHHFKVGHVIALSQDIASRKKQGKKAKWIDRLAARIVFLYRRDVFAFGVFLLMAIPDGAIVLQWLLVFFMPLEFAYFLYFTRRHFQAARSGKTDPAASFSAVTAATHDPDM